MATIRELAIGQGVDRIRRPEWEPSAYARIRRVGDSIGPWATIYDAAVRDDDAPPAVPLWQLDGDGWERFDGTPRPND